MTSTTQGAVDKVCVKEDGTSNDIVCKDAFKFNAYLATAGENDQKSVISMWYGNGDTANTMAYQLYNAPTSFISEPTFSMLVEQDLNNVGASIAQIDFGAYNVAQMRNINELVWIDVTAG